jgi:hypothetical protein
LLASRLACSDSSLIASQSTSKGLSSMGGSYASWARGMTSGHSTHGGHDTNVCALSCPSNWATESNANIIKTTHQNSGYYAKFQSKGQTRRPGLGPCSSLLLVRGLHSSSWSVPCDPGTHTPGALWPNMARSDD